MIQVSRAWLCACTVDNPLAKAHGLCACTVDNPNPLAKAHAGLCACTVDNPLAKARGLSTVQAHKPCSISHMIIKRNIIKIIIITVKLQEVIKSQRSVSRTPISQTASSYTKEYPYFLVYN